MNQAGVPPIDPNADARPGNGLLRLIKSRAAVVALGFIISLLLLFMTARKINWSQVSDAFSSGNWLPWLPLAVVTYLIGMLLRGLRLKQLVSTESNLTIATASNIIAVGYATNNILPARLGEFARAGMLAERTGLPYALSLTVTFLERLLDGLTILCLFVLASFVTPTHVWMKQAAAIAAVIFGFAIPSVMILAFSPQFALTLTSQLSSGLGRKWHNRALALVTQVTRGLSCLRDSATALSVLFTSFLVWLLEGLMFAMVMPCFRLAWSPIKALAVMSFTNLGILIPSSPGYVGPYHACCSEALQAVTGSIEALPPYLTLPFSIIVAGGQVSQVSEATALSYAVVVHLVFYATVTIWGVIAMARYGLELGTTAALAWQAKPIANLPTANLSVITSVPGQKYATHCFKVDAFWLAIVEASLPNARLQLSDEEKAEALRAATEFACLELGALQPHLRILFKIGLLGFRSLAMLSNCAPFEALPSEKRRTIFEGWAYGPIPITRKLFKPLRSLVLLAFYEQPLIQAALDRAALDQSNQPTGKPAKEAEIGNA